MKHTAHVLIIYNDVRHYNEWVHAIFPDYENAREAGYSLTKNNDNGDKFRIEKREIKVTLVSFILCEISAIMLDLKYILNELIAGWRK